MAKFYLSFSRYLTAMLMLITTVAWSQSKTVTGKVTSADDGTAIPGVNILEKGTNNGTVTDVDGTYSITVTGGNNATLVYSFVGYESQEVAVGTQSSITISLAPNVTALSEIVVIGYGEVQRRDATGSVASVKSEDFNRGVIASPEQLIQGKSAGVQITSASGEPGAGVNIRIRGTSSVRGGNNPLFVVDGIPLSGEDISAGGLDLGRGNAATKNPLNFLNPNDIESIDILKDASATAIYGSRGANGVVLITTKSGKGKRRQLEYAPTLSFSKMARRYDLLDRDQFLNGAEALGSSRAELDGGSNTDWQDEISRVAVSHRHDLSFSDNYKSGNYRASLSYDNQQGIIRYSGMERLTGRLNVNHSFLQDKLDLGAQLTLSRINDQAAPITNNSGFEGDLIGSTYMANPSWPSDPDIQPVSGNNLNPNSYLKYHQDNTETDRTLINLTGGYDITKELSFKVNAGFDRSSSTREKAFSSLLNMSNGVFGNGRGAIADIETSSNLLETYFNYQKKFENSNISAVLGYSYQEFNRKGKTVLGWGFDSPNMDDMIADLDRSRGIIETAIGNRSYQQYGYAPANPADGPPDFWINQLFPEPVVGVAISELPASLVKAVSGDIFDTTDELQSFFGRLNYSLQDKYLVTATVRADGSTKFGGNNKYGVFPSAALAWRLSEEEFVPDLFDDLKLRVGYGVTGNQEIPHNLHQTRLRFRRATAAGPEAPTIEADGRINPPGFSELSYANPNLKWEQTTQWNFGLDFGFGQGKFTGTLDFYNKVTSDLLIQVVSPQPAPQEFTWRNLDADVVNKGVELTLNYYAIDDENVGLNFGFNIARNTNKVERYAGAPLNTGEVNGQGLTGAFAQRIVNDQPLFTYFIREFTGFENGVAQYTEDKQGYVGKSPIPKYNLGLNLSFRYKKFDFAAFLNGQFGHYVYNNTANAYFNMGSLAQGKNVTKDVLGSGESPANAPDASTLFLEKGDFLRMQNLNIGYSFDFGQSFVKKLRVYASGQNVFLITDYKGLDPEVNINKTIATVGVPSLGIDYTSYPRARTFTIGVNATF